MILPLFALVAGAALGSLLYTQITSKSVSPIIAGIPGTVVKVHVPASSSSKIVPLPPEARFVTVYDSNANGTPSVYSKFATVSLESSHSKPIAIVRGSDLLSLGGRITIPTSATQMRITNSSTQARGMFVTLVIEI